MESDNKRIAKNTIFLYMRSFLMIGINIYSSRVILQALGVEDYGLYGAIGSIVMMFTIINGSLSSGTSRFLTFELGRGDELKLKKTFNASLTMHVAMAAFIFVLMETIGLWFVNYKMNIPAGREFAANMVYQLSILTCMFSLTLVPFNATIIAHERMDVYAYVGLCEALFKLALVFALLFVPFTDNLIAYAIIIASWNILLQLFYRFYCYKRFKETHLEFCREKYIYKDMLSYSLWDTVGAFCVTGNSQGINILINLFFGVTVNAARQVAYQVENAISQLANNLSTSVTPQIVKSYAKGDINRFFKLIYESGRYSYFLMFLVAYPLILEADYVLKLWLVEVPKYTVLFTQAILGISTFRIIVRSTINGVHATGDVKILNMTSGVWSIATFLPVSYFCFKIGLPVWSYLVAHGINGLICNFFEARSLYIRQKFNVLHYIVYVYLYPISVSLLAGIIPFLIVYSFEESIFRLLATVITSTICLGFSVYFLGIDQDTKLKIKNYITQKL